jgi:hypothetical protein
MATILFNPLGPPFDFSVSGGSSGPVDTLTGNDSITVSPQGNNINLVGSGSASSGISTAGNLYVSGNNGTATLTVNETQAQFLTNYTQTGVNYLVLPTDYLIGCTAANITLTLPVAPGANRILVIKDESGNATPTPITISGNGKNINGLSTLSLDQSYASFNLYFNGTAWFSY